MERASRVHDDIRREPLDKLGERLTLNGAEGSGKVIESREARWLL